MSKEMKMKPTRHGYGEALVQLGKENENVYVLGADLTSSTSANMFADEFPERFVEIGIAEQNMLNVAAGLALEGKIPFVSTYGVFIAGRAWDQIRTTVCYGNINVKIGGAHGGISVGPDGATHQALEEITIMRVLPNMTVVVPCDYWETMKATKYIATEINGPAYIRFGREAIPIITEEDSPFEFGKIATFREGKDVAIVACGMMVYWALEAAKELEKEGLITRNVDASQFPVKTEYALTESGRDFIPIISQMKKWSLKWKPHNELCESVDCKKCTL